MKSRLSSACARRLDLFGQAAHGQFAKHLGGAAHPAVVAPGADAAAAARCARGVVGKGGGLGEHGAAGRVQVAGEHVEHIHQPVGQGAELLRAGANAAIHRCARRVGQLSRQGANGLRRDAAAASHGLGRERQHGRLHRVHATDPGGHAAQLHQLFVKQRVHHAQQQKHIGTGSDEVVGVGHVGGFGAARVHHHQLAAARLHGFGFALEVGHGNAESVAKHQPAGELLGHLVQGRGREHIARAQRLGHAREVQQQPHLVR